MCSFNFLLISQYSLLWLGGNFAMNDPKTTLCVLFGYDLLSDWSRVLSSDWMRIFLKQSLLRWKSHSEDFGGELSES